MDVTVWNIYESRMVLLLLDFLDVDKEMQGRLMRRLATTEQKMKRWMWNEKKRCFGGIGDNEVICHVGYGSMLPFALNLIGFGNVKIDDYICHLLNTNEVRSEE